MQAGWPGIPKVRLSLPLHHESTAFITKHGILHMDWGGLNSGPHNKHLTNKAIIPVQADYFFLTNYNLASKMVTDKT